MKQIKVSQLILDYYRPVIKRIQVSEGYWSDFIVNVDYYILDLNYTKIKVSRIWFELINNLKPRLMRRVNEYNKTIS